MKSLLIPKTDHQVNDETLVESSKKSKCNPLAIFIISIISLEAIAIMASSMYYQRQINGLSQQFEDFKVQIQSENAKSFFQAKRPDPEVTLCTCTTEISALNSSIISVQDDLNQFVSSLHDEINTNQAAFLQYSGYVNSTLSSLSTNLTILSQVVAQNFVQTNAGLAVLTLKTSQLNSSITTLNGETNSLNQTLSTLIPNSLSGVYQIPKFLNSTLALGSKAVLLGAVQIHNPANGYAICSGNLNYNYNSQNTSVYYFEIYLNNASYSQQVGCSDETNSHCFINFEQILPVTNLTTNISLFAVSKSTNLDVAWLSGSSVNCNLFS